MKEREDRAKAAIVALQGARGAMDGRTDGGLNVVGVDGIQVHVFLGDAGDHALNEEMGEFGDVE